MMIKIWRYEARATDVVGGATAQNLAFGTSLSTGRYIFAIGDATGHVLTGDLVRPVGDYVADLNRTPDRVAGRYAYNLTAEEPEAQIDELASHAASAGLDRFWHLVVSHRPGEELTDEEGEAIRRIVAKVLGVEECPMIWATHQDTDHLHDHGLIVSFLADTNEPVAFGEGWWKEKAQIAIAICEYRLGLEPEPNRRYVADDTGVYHLLTQTKVADAEGKLLLDREAMRTMQRDHDEAVLKNEAPAGFEPGQPWTINRSAQMLAKPCIEKAKSWQEVHKRLAGIGYRYVKVGNTGVLEAVTVAGRWSECEGLRCGAGDAYANAALGKLSKRLKADYVPPAPDLAVRAFVTPCYNAPEKADAADQAARKEELSEYKALVEGLETDYKARYTKKLVAEKGDGANAARKRRKAAHQAELAAVKAQRQHVVTPSKITAARGPKACTQPKPEVSALLWGEPRQAGETTDVGNRPRDHLDDHYHVVPGKDETRYYLDGRLAIIERARTIQLLIAARQARIHAVQLAQSRFRKLRLVARQKLRQSLARIAAELDIGLLPQRLADAVMDHRTKVANQPGSGIVERARTWSRYRDRLVLWRSKTRQDRKRRAQDALSFDREAIRDFRRRNDAELNAPWQPNPPPDVSFAALRTLDRIDRNQLHLVRSRYNVDGARFLDDPLLRASYRGRERQIILPVVQSRLEAIEAVQIEQRRWIAAAVLSGRVELSAGNLKAAQERDAWAEPFWDAQKDDPSFQRLLAVSRLRSDRFAFNLDERPEVRAWRAVRARGDERLIGAMAEEFFAASVRHGNKFATDARYRKVAAPPKAADVAWSYRHELFEAMGYDDAEALRRTKGSFAETYQGHAYHKPGETDRDWDNRTRAYAQNFGPKGGRYSR